MTAGLDWNMPWKNDVFLNSTPTPVRVRWDYVALQVVDDTMCGIFDTTWTYCHDGITVTGWWVLKDPWSGPQYLLEAEVPEMVRFAVLVVE